MPAVLGGVPEAAPAGGLLSFVRIVQAVQRVDFSCCLNRRRHPDFYLCYIKMGSQTNGGVKLRHVAEELFGKGAGAQGSQPISRCLCIKLLVNNTS